MCGIIGYIGPKKALPIVMDGLKRMEYRGYDSSGVATIEIQGPTLVKKEGHLYELENILYPEQHQGTLGIGHIRWATHGVPNTVNAHPHHDCSKTIFIAHNGIIENHASLRQQLREHGHAIASDTDSELIAHIIESYVSQGESLEQSVKQTLPLLRGTYGLVIISASERKLIAARFGSPVILGIIGDGEYVVASDVSAIINHTRDVIYLEEGEMVTITPAGYRITSADQNVIERTTQRIDWTPGQIEKQGYETFMLKEIHEQPECIENATRGRTLLDEGMAKLGGVEQVANTLKTVNNIMIVGCGTAWHAGLIAEYWLEELTGIPTGVEYASEYRYRAPTTLGNTAALFISQSGETADTLAALREAKRRNYLTLGIVNVVGSTIARETDAGMYNHAGPEIAVASTKAFISQLTLLMLFAISVGRKRQLPPRLGKQILTALTKIPGQINEILKDEQNIFNIAKKYAAAKNMMFIGRQQSFPVALEGALKLKEISYIHAEGYAAGELKHGPIALIEPDVPTVAVIPHDAVFEKTLSNIQEIKARKGKVIAVTDQEDEHLRKTADDMIVVPKTLDILSPLLTVVPLQLFAYAIARERGLNVDKPRNLAKSVTVE